MRWQQPKEPVNQDQRPRATDAMYVHKDLDQFSQR